MEKQPFDDSEYPYAARPPAILPPVEYVPRPPRAIAWGTVFVWLVRLSLAGAVSLALIALPIGVVAYRARSQAAAIQELEDRGCGVGYSNNIEPGSLQDFLRDVFGNEYFGEVDFIAATELHKPESAMSICRLSGNFKKLESFSIHSDHFRFEQIANWRHLDNLTSLGIRSSKLTDDDLLRISRMPKLTALDISSDNISEAGLRHLSRLTQLESLSIESNRLDGSGPASETGFPMLQSLTVQRSAQIGDQSIVNLGPMPELTQIILDETQIGDQAIEHLTAGGNLDHVYVSKARITDKGLGNLARCSRLSILDLTDTGVTDDGIAKLQPCSELTILNVSGTKVTGKGLAVIRGHELGLNVDRTEVDDHGLATILTIPGLTLLAANETKVTGTGAKLLSEMSTLEHLRLEKTLLSEVGIKTLSQATTRRIDLCQTPLDDQTLLFFVGNDRIEYLNICETKVTVAGVLAFCEARKQRLEAANRNETLWLECDFPDTVEPYLPKADYEMPLGGLPFKEPSVDIGPAPPSEPPKP